MSRVNPFLIASALFILGASAADAHVLVTVDKSAQEMTVSVDGVQRWTWPVSTGRRGYATPSGKFTAFRMEAEHYSKEFDDAPMPHSIFFTKRGHAIHGTLESKYLGRAVSHGCVRLSTANAAKLYALVQQQGVTNMTVVVSGGEPAAVARTTPRRTPQRLRETAQDEDYGRPQGGSYAAQQGYYRPQQGYYQPQPGYYQQPRTYQPSYFDRW
jgi:hypothetical protein